MNRRAIAALLTASLLSGCAHPGQNRYDTRDVGISSVVEFGTVITSRQVEITGQNTGAGAASGMVAGGAAGSAFGSGNGSLAGLLAGVIIGGLAGAAVEQELQGRKGIEYVITVEGGQTLSIVQNVAGDDAPIRPGQRVMVQTSGGYRRVLPAEALPERIAKPKGIEVLP